MPDYKLYDLNITTLTPLHIGTGRELLHEYDYAIHDKKTWVINQAALLNAQKGVDDPRIAERLATIPPAQLLRNEDFVIGNRLFRYVLKGQPRSSGEGIQVREQFKGVFDQIYLPGSGLKGALRTVIGWHAWKELGLEPDPAKLRPRREWAGAGYEQLIFGRDPNNDSMRALQVSDSDCSRCILPALTERARDQSWRGAKCAGGDGGHPPGDGFYNNAETRPGSLFGLGEEVWTVIGRRKVAEGYSSHCQCPCA